MNAFGFHDPIRKYTCSPEQSGSPMIAIAGSPMIAIVFAIV